MKLHGLRRAKQNPYHQSQGVQTTMRDLGCGRHATKPHSLCCALRFLASAPVGARPHQAPASSTLTRGPEAPGQGSLLLAFAVEIVAGTSVVTATQGFKLPEHLPGWNSALLPETAPHPVFSVQNEGLKNSGAMD